MAQNLLRVRQTLMPSRVLCLQTANYHGRSKIGNREIVGYGIQGEPMYHDHPTFPFASVRYIICFQSYFIR